MPGPWRGLLFLLGLLCGAEAKCSPTTFYKSCWIRRFPGVFIDVLQSQGRGAQLLGVSQEDSALRCSRTCCLASNASCNLAVFHYETVQSSVNCFHLNCPTLESCILKRRSNVILYNITKGVDPDLLVFGKHFSSSLRLWPNLSSSKLNFSESSSTDKRHFHRPPFPSSLTQTSPGSQGRTLPQSTDWETRSTTSTAFVSVATRETTSVSNAVDTFSTEVAVGHSRETSTANIYPGPPVHFTAGSPATKPYSNIAILAHFDSSKQYPNDTKGYVSRNHTSEDEPGSLTPVWDIATGTLLVPVVICSSILLACCCTVLFAVGWRSRKRGHYRTSWRVKRGSMRLIKYVIVRESL
ncbi:MANSC domain-containing protein 4 [Amia ocellicauda]|uniref:MANSC domain-containing protein 4 n=1 Tax=Amia ocellicauda TaxID=2972642 RepID=UPI003464C1D0